MKDVYRLSLKNWNGPPHFAEAYFDENKQIILLSSLTEKGFMALAEGLNKCGYNFDSEPAIRVNLSMLNTAS